MEDHTITFYFKDNTAIIRTLEGNVAVVRLKQDIKNSNLFTNGYFNLASAGIHDGIEVDPISDTLTIHLAQPVFEEPEECLAYLEQHFGLIAKEFEE